MYTQRGQETVVTIDVVPGNCDIVARGFPDKFRRGRFAGGYSTAEFRRRRGRFGISTASCSQQVEYPVDKLAKNFLPVAKRERHHE
jgi:hypothetical protein